MIKKVCGALLLMTLLACGGGGGATSSSATLVGRVLDISTGAPFTSPATVQTTVASASTAVTDGSFSVKANSGTSTLTVNPPSILSYPIFNFIFSPQTQVVNDLGDLWVGPQKVTVTGVVHNAATSLPVSGAKLRFGGQSATSGSDGTFQIMSVGYSNANTSSFLGLVGNIDATNFFSNEFTANGNTAISGVVNVGEILMTPLDSDSPPGLPFNIWGVIAPSGLASGTIVTLKDSGNTVVRRFTVGTDARYQFWVNAGVYSIEFQNGTHTATPQNVTLNNSSDVIRADATLN